MAVVQYTDNEGFKWVVAVVDNTPEEDYEYGAILGPPDLSSLELLPSKQRELHNALVDADLYNAPQLMGKRKLLLNILARLGLPNHMLKRVLYIFQYEYYGDK